MAKSKQQRAKVSERALVARINRQLKKNDQQLRRGRGVWASHCWQPADSGLGWYFVVNPNRNYIVETHIDLEELGRRLEVLEAWEELAEDE
ncbi:MAG TPA: hypothetical protein VL175_15085 [Pirellulales bacterium]|jgi:hypothetical protein|nr:hypothetical protein [Pirellulales bacterium]